MKIRIKKNTCFLILYLIYNLLYVLYMTSGIVSRNIYLIFIIIYCICCLFAIAQYYNYKILSNRLVFIYEVKKISMIIICFFIISLFYQIINADLEFYLIVDLLDLILPILIVFCILNTDKVNVKKYVIILFLRSLFIFVYEQAADFSVQKILLINWFDSTSSVFENSLAHTFLLITVLFLLWDEKKLAILSSLLCYCSFKRVAVLFLVIFWVLLKRLPDISINKEILKLIKLMLIMVPFLILWIYSQSGMEWFEAKFGIDFTFFSMSRNNLINEVLRHFDGNYNGFGTIDHYFATKNSYYATIGSMHCDFLLIYLECGILGIAIFVNNIIDVLKHSWKTLLVGAYFFMELIVTHFLSGIPEWMLLYLIIYTVRKQSNDL